MPENIIETRKMVNYRQPTWPSNNPKARRIDVDYSVITNNLIRTFATH